MIDNVLGRVPVEHRFNALYLLLAAAVFVSGYAANMFQRETTVTRIVHHDKTVQEQYGRPSQTVDGGQVNPQLAGFRCDLYASRGVIICHR